MALMREALVGTMGLVQKLTADTDKRIAENDRRIAENEKRAAESEKRMAALDERLNAFIIVVERYITRNGNGKKPKS